MIILKEALKLDVIELFKNLNSNMIILKENAWQRENGKRLTFKFQYDNT